MLELECIFNEWHSMMPPGHFLRNKNDRIFIPEEKVLWLSTGILEKPSNISVPLLKVTMKI